MKVFAAGFLLVLFVGALVAADPRPAPPLTFEQANAKARQEKAAPVDDGSIYGLKPGPGREMVLANCIGCHSGRLIASQRLSRRRWEQTMTQMNQKHGLWSLPPFMKDRILEYLATYQGEPEPGDLRETPWAQPLYQPNPIW